MNEYITSLGKRVEFVPIGPLLDKLTAALNIGLSKVQPPTYTVPTATGVNEVWPLVEQIPKTDKEWDELIERQKSADDKNAIARYRADRAVVKAEYSKNLMRLVLTRGIKVEMPEDEGWVEEHRWLGMSVPDDPRERRLHYIETECMAVAEDYRQVVCLSFETSEVREELISLFEAAFQRPVEKRGRADTERTVGVAGRKRKAQ